MGEDEKATVGCRFDYRYRQVIQFPADKPMAQNLPRYEGVSMAFEKIRKNYRLLFSGAEKFCRDFFDMTQDVGPFEKIISEMGYYPYIASDFFPQDSATVDEYSRWTNEVDKHVIAIRSMPTTARTEVVPDEKSKNLTTEISNLLITLHEGHKMGFGTSLGFNKYFDDSLLRWDGVFRSMVLFVAHDWYPLIWESSESIHTFELPIEQYGVIGASTPYGKAIQPATTKEHLIGFINLIPGYRREFSSPQGRIRGAKYDMKAEQLAPIISHLNNRFHGKLHVVMWGRHVQKSLEPRLLPEIRNNWFYHSSAYGKLAQAHKRSQKQLLESL